MSDFIAHGTYTVTNSIGYLVQISDDGSAARLKINGYVTDWLEIEYMEDEDNPDELVPIIDPNRYNVPLNLVMKL